MYTVKIVLGGFGFGFGVSGYDKQFKNYDSELNLRYVKINIHATTYDRITKDRAAKFVDKMSAIGGTMGLLTGFSIVSAVEIAYYGMKTVHKIFKGLYLKREYER